MEIRASGKEAANGISKRGTKIAGRERKEGTARGRGGGDIL